MVPYIVDIGTSAVSIALIGGYHLYLQARVRHNPSYAIQSVDNDARSAWMENIMPTKATAYRRCRLGDTAEDGST